MVRVNITSDGLIVKQVRVRVHDGDHMQKTLSSRQAQANICRNLAIVQDGEHITMKEIASFVAEFKDKLPENVIGAMRTFFCLDNKQVNTTKDDLLAHGGATSHPHLTIKSASPMGDQ
ncbi:hypothetical protein D1007_36767 [Hordeum vulgare]|nr:hypothetical protein D1007_36767 [Hordeum vulgare]